MAYARRWSITSLDKLRRVCAALCETSINFRTHPMELVFRDPFMPKSDGQRALFHAVVDDIAPLLGYTPGELKDVLKDEYFGDDWRELGLSTEQLDHEHYGHLIELAYYRAAWAGLYVPDRRTR